MTRSLWKGPFSEIATKNQKIFQFRRRGIHRKFNLERKNPK